jgi:hypothetical protein
MCDSDPTTSAGKQSTLSGFTDAFLSEGQSRSSSTATNLAGRHGKRECFFKRFLVVLATTQTGNTMLAALLDYSFTLTRRPRRTPR